VRARAVRGHAAAVRVAERGSGLPRGGGSARGGIPAARVAAAARDDPAAGPRAVPLLAPLPGAALRGAGGRRGPLMDPELERKNLIFGLALLAIFLVLLFGVIGAVFVYFCDV